jgi:hypothetical protein
VRNLPKNPEDDVSGRWYLRAANARSIRPCVAHISSRREVSRVARGKKTKKTEGKKTKSKK